MPMTLAEKRPEGNILHKRLQLKLVGGFEICRLEKGHVLDKRKACAILAYLVLNGRTHETRGRLSALLWSDSDEEHARASLRQSIRDLKRLEAETGVEFLVADKLSVGIDRDALETDVGALPRALKARDFAAVDSILNRGGGTLCMGLEDCDPAFDNWMRTTSTSWSDGVINHLSRLLDAPNSTMAERKAISSCILRLDPLHERAVIEALHACFREGGYARARAYFERYGSELRSELDLAPPREIMRLLGEFKTTSHHSNHAVAVAPERVPSGATSQPGVEKPTIVLVTEKGTANEAHIQVALVSELSASLSRFRHWTAIQAELDSDVVRGRSVDALRAAIGESVDLAVVIAISGEGSSRCFEISCTHLATGHVQFTTTAPLMPSTWRSVFNDICAKVASRLQIAISMTRLHRIDEQSPNYVSAYDSWLDGQRLSILWQTDTEAAAIARYEDAIRRDPSLACAYSSLAAVLNSRWIVLPGYPVEGADLGRAYELAKEAVTLDPLDHRNQVNLAWCHLLARRWELADFHFGLAYDLNSANPATLIAYSLASSFMGDHDRAVRLSQRSFELNPLHEPHYHGYRATVAFLADDLQGCVESVEKSDRLFPDIRGWSAAAHALLGNDAKAGAEFRMFIRGVSAAWYNGERPSRQSAIRWFKSVFPIRLDGDREKLSDGIDRAAQLA